MILAERSLLTSSLTDTCDDGEYISADEITSRETIKFNSLVGRNGLLRDDQPKTKFLNLATQGLPANSTKGQSEIAE